MQERHDRGLKKSVMLGLALQTSWVMENLHDSRPRHICILGVALLTNLRYLLQGLRNRSEQ